jgi:predicted HicB family RNase H-like nuclease
MKDALTYKGFIGSVHFSAEDEVFHGKLEGIDDMVTFEGGSVRELVKAFHAEVDDYLALCKRLGKEPHKSFKGSFNVRISPDIHRKAALKAAMMGVSLNHLIQTAVEKEVEAVG